MYGVGVLHHVLRAVPHAAAAHCLRHAEEPQNLKALYRRGQAYAALQQHQAAEQDLQASLELSGHDPQQQQLIREKLRAVRDKLAVEQQEQGKQASKQQQQQREVNSLQESTGPGAAAAAGAANATAAAVAESGAHSQPSAAPVEEEDGLIEEVQEKSDDNTPGLQEVPELDAIGVAAPTQPRQQQQRQQPSSSSSSQRQANASSTSSSNSNGAGGFSGFPAGMDGQMAQMAAMMRQNPAMMQQVRKLPGWQQHGKQQQQRLGRDAVGH